MNKLLTLINLEIKRNSKFCIMYILGFFAFILGANLYSILNVSKNVVYLNSLIRKYGGLAYGSEILANNIFIFEGIAVGIVGILFIYTVMIWKSDYDNKSIYTLMMIPKNKFYIYLAKVISVVTMVYAHLISSTIALFISKNIFTVLLKNKGIIKTSLYKDLSVSGLGKLIFPANFIDFLMVYVVWLVLVISVLFLLCLIVMCIKSSLRMMLLMIGIYPIAILLLMIIYSYKIYKILGMYTIGNIGVDFILNLSMIIVLNIISYILINKKLYI